jgi:hypothetical protein
MRAILAVAALAILPACGDDGDTIIQQFNSGSFASGTIVALAIGGDVIFNVSPSAPAPVIRSLPLSGLPSGVTIVSMDFRPANGRLYGRASNGSLYQIDTSSGAVLVVGGSGITFSPTPALEAVSFNAVADRLRYVDSEENNVRFDVDTGAVFTDTMLSPPGSVSAIAYTNRFAGATSTTLYGLDSGTDSLVMIGGLGGSPSPNGGVVSTIGPWEWLDSERG